MKCNAAPYEGTDKYIFVSYCHKDKAKVYPYIELMAREGYRVWYDEGINPGTEWPEIIAEKLSGAEFFLAFITEASLASHNCRREINFAIQRKKSFTACFLEDVNLTLGMEMILSTVQAVYQRNYASRKECLEKIYKNIVLKQCLGEKNYHILISEYQTEQKNDKKIVERSTDIYKNFFLNDVDTTEEKLSVSVEDTSEPREELKDKPEKDLTESPDDLFNSTGSMLYRVDNDEFIELAHFPFSIGRKKDVADYIIEEDRQVSRKHALIVDDDGILKIKDNKSLNGVQVNGTQIPRDELVALVFGSIICIGETDFIYLPFKPELIKSFNKEFSIVDESSGDEMYISKPVIRVGRTASKSDFVINDKSVSRIHSVISRYKNELYVVDLLSHNGTFISGDRIESGKLTHLPADARISFSGSRFHVKAVEKIVNEVDYGKNKKI